MELMLDHLERGMYLSLLLSLPAVLLAAGIGLIVGILQAVTQVQEQTIAAAPKILAVFMLIILGGGLMLNLLNGYLLESVQIAMEEVPADGQFLMPPQTKDERARAITTFFADGRPLRGDGWMKRANIPGDDAKQAKWSQAATGASIKPKVSVSEQLHMQKGR